MPRGSCCSTVVWRGLGNGEVRLKVAHAQGWVGFVEGMVRVDVQKIMQTI